MKTPFSLLPLVVRRPLLWMGLLGLLGIGLSCEKKNQGPYDIEVRVVNEDGLPIQNCLIRMYAPVGADGTINAYATTGFDGVALFEYAYPAYLQLDAVKGSWKGCGFAELRDVNLVETTIIIKPFSDPNNGCPPQ